MTETGPVQVGVSSCLLGLEVRFDGGHKEDAFVNRVLSEYFELVAFCPEVEIGLGVPRDPIRLERRDGAVRVVSVKQPALDVTEPLHAYGCRVAGENRGLSGYILKSKSPSCGMERVKVHDAAGGVTAADGVGEYARALMDQWPELPVVEEWRLNDPVLRDNFIERVFTYKRWQNLVAEGLTAARIVDFHTRHKLMIMARSQQVYRALERLVAACGGEPVASFGERYIGELMKALQVPASRRNHANVLEDAPMRRS